MLPHSPSCPATAGHPVITAPSVVTGSPACAGDDSAMLIGHSSAIPLPRCRGAPSILFLPLETERERSADQRILVTSTPGEACAPNDVGRTPTGAPPPCFATTAPFFRNRTGAHAPCSARCITLARSSRP